MVPLSYFASREMSKRFRVIGWVNAESFTGTALARMSLGDPVRRVGDRFAYLFDEAGIDIIRDLALCLIKPKTDNHHIPFGDDAYSLPLRMMDTSSHAPIMAAIT
jgi:hypothetical protein